MNFKYHIDMTEVYGSSLKITKTLQQRGDEFVKWLEACGCERDKPTNEYEVLRYRVPKIVKGKFKMVTQIVYRKTNGALTWTQDTRLHWDTFIAGKKLPKVTRPDGYKEPKRQPSKSLNKRMTPRLLMRDGDDCWYCGHTMIGCAEDGGDDITIEHLVSKKQYKTAKQRVESFTKLMEEGTSLTRKQKRLLREARRVAQLLKTVDDEHNLTLAHAKCNRQAGHYPVDVKHQIRDYLLANPGTDVEHWEGFNDDD